MMVATAESNISDWEERNGAWGYLQAVRINGKFRIPLDCGDAPSTAWK